MPEQSFIQLQAELDNESVLKAMDEIDKRIEQMAASGDEHFQQLAAKLEQNMTAIRAAARTGALQETDLEELLGIEDPENFRKRIEGVLRDVRNLAKIEPELTPVAKQDIVGGLQLERAQEQFQLLQQTATQFLDSSSSNAQEFGQTLNAELTEAATLLEGDEAQARQFVETMKLLVSEANQMSSTLKKAGSEENQLDRRLKIQVAADQMDQLRERTQRMIDSNNPRAQQLGNTLQQVGVKATQAFKRGETTAGEFEKEIRKTNSTAGQMERRFGTGIPAAANRGYASLYRLGTAAQQLGVYGAGPVLHFVGAIQGIHPAGIAAGAAIGIVVVAITKLTEVAFKATKALAKMFVQVVKDSVIVSEELELLDRQLTNIFEGKAELAGATMRQILELSTEFGVDLSSDIARIFLPLVDSFDQFEQIAELASTLVIGFNRTDEEVSRALKQAAAGHFRPLQEQFGLLASDIEVIKQMQEETDALTGVIDGLNEYLKRSGQEWDTYEGTLRRVRGSLEQYQKLAQAVLGEPVRIALVEELDDLLKIIDQNRDQIELILESVGRATAGLVGDIGGVFEGLFDNIDIGSLESILESIDSIFLYLGEIPETTIGIFFPNEEAINFLQIIDGILTVTEEIVFEVANWAAGMKALVDFADDLTVKVFGTEEALRGVVDGVLGLFGPGFNFTRDLGLVVREDSGALEEHRQRLDEARAARQEFIDGIVNGTDSIDDERDALLGANAALQANREAIAEAVEAQKELNEATSEFALESSRKIQDIEIELGRRRIDIAIDASEKRADAERKLQLELIDINQKHQDRIRQQLVDSGDDSLDNFIDYQRDLVDLEIEGSREREDRERKHQERLKDIRQRFAFDAQEALRQNDAVAFLRIKRRMEFELREEKERAEEERQQAVDEERRKREDLLREYQRGEEDIERSNQRKLRDLQTRLDIELREEREKHEESLNEITIWEQRKNEELQLWLEREIDDFALWQKRKIEEMRNKYAEEEAVVRAGEKAKVDIAMQYAQQYVQVWQQAISSVGRLFGGAGGGGTGGRFGGAQPDVVGQIGDQPGGTGGLNRNQLLYAARRAIEQADWLSHQEQITLLSTLDSSSDATLRRLIRQLNGSFDVPANIRHQGGRVSTGVQYSVNQGEPFIPVQAGIVSPAIGPMSMPNLSQVQAGNTYDYSRPVTADISLTDPSQLSPTQRTIILNLITEEILKHAAQ